MRKFKRILATGLIVATMMSTTGCGFIKPYDVPELVTIEASQTAFLIPLVGNTNDQASFESEELLRDAKVATKEIQIPHRWVQTGRLPGTGEWRQAARLIVVERTPVTREWNSSKDGGTNSTNQAIYAESKESIGFSVGMNCSAQIYTEDDAVKFLYSYNNKSLSNIMDTEIRARVESKFVEECGKRTLNDILASKEEIMDVVRTDVENYFGDKGITITVLGLKDGVEYDDQAIQASINEKFSSEQKLVTQQNNNKVTIAKAEADAEAKLKVAQAEAETMRIKAEAEAEANRKISESLTGNLLEKIKYEKWDGTLPQIQGSATPIVNMGE